MGRCTGLLLMMGIFFVDRSICNNILKPKIAIIGAGIGGASTSHFLTELFKGTLVIDIFESNKIGGRLDTVEVGGNLYEAGGSIIDSENRYMRNFIKLLGMEENPMTEPMRAGLWNGNEFVFTESSWRIATVLKLLYRYGIQPIKLYRHVNSVLESFGNIYQHQDNGLAYDKVVDLLSAMSPEFPKLLQISTAEYLYSKGFSVDVVNELVKAILVTYYGQSTDVHSFVGCVSVGGALAGHLSVKGGNKELPIQLIHRNNQVNLVYSQVRAVRYVQNEDSPPQYEISYTNADSNDMVKDIYDIVVLATPLTEDQKNQIQFTGFPENENPIFPGNFQTTVVTLVKGDLNLDHFGLDKSLDTILSCNPNKTIVNFVDKVFPVDGTTGNAPTVWRIFSKKPLTSNQINLMFLRVDQVQDIQWKSSPVYGTSSRLDKFQLYDSLYHVNAIEWAASAMEMSAIAGKNVANLIHNKLTSCCKDSSMNDKRNCKYNCKEEKGSRGTRNVEL